jgi:hypothetical protein
VLFQRQYLDSAEPYLFEQLLTPLLLQLGHGSNVRGLETTATWNPKDRTFILHSPSLTASKWWIGSLGRTANHAAGASNSAPKLLLFARMLRRELMFQELVSLAPKTYF